MNSQAFRQIFESQWPTLEATKVDRVVAFRELVVTENAQQNLTTLLSPEAFYFGHVVDVQRLLEFSGLEYPAVDLGSGCGVPGLLASLISEKPWFLVESEKRKAAFLLSATQALGVSGHVRVVDGRAEQWLSGAGASAGVKSVVCRAVGPVDRIYGWLNRCSTWNNLVLLKGPGWTAEWETFQIGANRGELTMALSEGYSVGPENKTRIIVRLDRVPRGTIRKK
jgi:16S rRNA G527 N7-methylase RsmG